jgi:acyl-CoA reductase-like NAD-dependent aldehyde dehydrogenase
VSPLTASIITVSGWCSANARAARWFREFARIEIPHDVVRDDEAARVEARRRPLGVVGSIVPSNFPVFLAGVKTAPALLIGNTVVLKPSPYTPLATLELGAILQESLPPGVFNVVSGGDDLGAAITHHPAVRMLCFTGSVATGKKVAAAAAPDLKRLVLELGGNDPAIVLEDADPAAIAERLFSSAFGNTGQVCIAAKRGYAHESVYQPLVEAMAEIATRVRVGPGIEPDTQLGPLSNAPQFQRVDELVEDAKRAGAQVVTGGAPLDRPGYFYPPTIITGIADGVRLVDEEQFGPALPVMPFREFDEALERANATHYGLMGSVWTQDLERGAEVAARLEVGTVGVNKHGSSWATPPASPPLCLGRLRSCRRCPGDTTSPRPWLEATTDQPSDASLHRHRAGVGAAERQGPQRPSRSGVRSPAGGAQERGFARVDGHLDALQRQRQALAGRLDERFLAGPGEEEGLALPTRRQRAQRGVLAGGQADPRDRLEVRERAQGLDVDADASPPCDREEREAMRVRQAETQRGVARRLRQLGLPRPAVAELQIRRVGSRVAREQEPQERAPHHEAATVDREVVASGAQELVGGEPLLEGRDGPLRGVELRRPDVDRLVAQVGVTRDGRHTASSSAASRRSARLRASCRTRGSRSIE